LGEGLSSFSAVRLAKERKEGTRKGEGKEAVHMTSVSQARRGERKKGFQRGEGPNNSSRKLVPRKGGEKEGETKRKKERAPFY